MADGAHSDHPAVQKQLDRLSMLSPGRDVLGLERITEVLERLGNPHRQLPPVFHVAGTNGKGSTCAFLRAVIEAEGLSAHVYTSPHLVRFNERIRIAGSLIEDEYLATLLARVLDISEDINPSFFEATTAAAMIAFAEASADVCILEVGLGGRLDATNVIAKPAATGIAALGIDHESFLLTPEDGAPADPMVRIAWEKAGIAKADTVMLTQDYSDDMNHAIAQHCEDTGAIYMPRGDIWNCETASETLTYTDKLGELTLSLPALSGKHQADNAALAIAMLRHQDEILISEKSYSAAMKSVVWPGRLQKLEAGPIANILSDTDIWLDGGHNKSAGEAVAHFLEGLEGQTSIIIGMLSNKDPASLLHRVNDLSRAVVVVPVPGHDSHNRAAFGGENLNISEAADVSSALQQLHPQEPKTVLITGSLYLAGEVLRLNRQLPG